MSLPAKHQTREYTKAENRSYRERPFGSRPVLGVETDRIIPTNFLETEESDAAAHIGCDAPVFEASPGHSFACHVRNLNALAVAGHAECNRLLTT